MSTIGQTNGISRQDELGKFGLQVGSVCTQTLRNKFVCGNHSVMHMVNAHMKISQWELASVNAS